MRADVMLASGRTVRIVAVPSLGGPVIVDCGPVVLVQSRCPLAPFLDAIVALLNVAGAAVLSII